MIKKLILRLKLKFAQHELWAVNFGLNLPFLSLFGFASLWVWFFIPMIPVGVLFVYLIESFPLLGLILNMLIGVPILLILAYWVFRWYFISVTLMFGRRKMAEEKKAEVIARIDKLLPA